MMGRHDPQRSLYCIVDLDSRIPESHPLRTLKWLVDFSFVRCEVAPFYGYNGHESIDPEIVLKLMQPGGHPNPERPMTNQRPPASGHTPRWPFTH